MAVSLSLANHHASLPVAWRLFLPKEWAANPERRGKAGVPDEIDFKTKPEIALEQIEAALKAGLSRGVVLMDAGYGCKRSYDAVRIGDHDPALRQQIFDVAKAQCEPEILRWTVSAPTGLVGRRIAFQGDERWRRL